MPGPCKGALLGLVLLGLIVCPVSLDAAPTISEVTFSSPASGQEGEPILIFVDELVDPVQVFFSDGNNPTQEATPVLVDIARGVVLVLVPPTAETGDMIVRANGVDSPPFYLRVAGGVFTPGSREVSGTITRQTDATPLQGVLVMFISQGPCEFDQVLWDYAETDATGNYTLNGIDGDYDVLRRRGSVPAAVGIGEIQGVRVYERCVGWNHLDSVAL